MLLARLKVQNRMLGNSCILSDFVRSRLLGHRPRRRRWFVACAQPCARILKSDRRHGRGFYVEVGRAAAHRPQVVELLPDDDIILSPGRRALSATTKLHRRMALGGVCGAATCIHVYCTSLRKNFKLVLYSIASSRLATPHGQIRGPRTRPSDTLSDALSHQVFSSYHNASSGDKNH